jgi:hypothetical protein
MNMSVTDSDISHPVDSSRKTQDARLYCPRGDGFITTEMGFSLRELFIEGNFDVVGVTARRADEKTKGRLTLQGLLR